MNHTRFFRQLLCSIIIVVFSQLYTSCAKKPFFEEQTGVATVTFNFNGLSANKVASIQNNKSERVLYYKADNERVFEVRIQEDNASSGVTSSNKKSQIQTTIDPVSLGVPIRILAFDKNTDTLCAEVLHITNSSSSQTSMQLTAGMEYKFVAASFNLKDDYYFGPDNPQLPMLRVIPITSSTSTNSKTINNTVFNQAQVFSMDPDTPYEEFAGIPYHMPIYHDIIEDVGPLNIGVNELEFELEQKHCQVSFTLDESESPYEEPLRIRPMFTSDKALFSNNTISFSLTNGELLSYNSDPYDNSVYNNYFKSIDGSYVFHMLDEDPNAKCLIQIENASVNDPNVLIQSDYHRFIELDNILLRNGLRYNINIKIMENSSMPTDVTILDLKYINTGSTDRNIIIN